MRNSRERISSLDKGILVLFAISEKSPIGIREIAATTGLPASTVYRLVAILRKRGLVRQEVPAQRYGLGLRILELHDSLLCHLDIWDAARPHISRLAELHPETVHLTVRSHDQAVTLDVIESKEPLRFTPPRGGTVPLHCGAQAKAILAFLRSDEISSYVATTQFHPLTPNTITDPQTLLSELNRIRQNGYAHSVEEIHIGAAGVAAPIFNRSHAAIGSCGVTGPVHRLNHEQLHDVTADVMRCARDISRALGASERNVSSAF